jgi:hypothetical protein
VLFGDPLAPVAGAAEPAVPVRLTLVDATAAAGEARLSWFCAAGAAEAIVERRTDATDWNAIGAARALGQGSFTYVDPVGAGRYGYRLRVGGDVSDEAWLDVPPAAFVLALGGFRPNPATASRTVAFTLASSLPATLAVIDVRGRAVQKHDVGVLGPGPHTIELGATLPAGVYWLSLRQGGVVRQARGVVLR